MIFIFKTLKEERIKIARANLLWRLYLQHLLSSITISHCIDCIFVWKTRTLNTHDTQEKVHTISELFVAFIEYNPKYVRWIFVSIPSLQDDITLEVLSPHSSIYEVECSLFYPSKLSISHKCHDTHYWIKSRSKYSLRFCICTALYLFH